MQWFKNQSLLCRLLHLISQLPQEVDRALTTNCFSQTRKMSYVSDTKRRALTSDPYLCLGNSEGKRYLCWLQAQAPCSLESETSLSGFQSLSPRSLPACPPVAHSRQAEPSLATLTISHSAQM